MAASSYNNAVERQQSAALQRRGVSRIKRVDKVAPSSTEVGKLFSMRAA